jgi:hypothetical protein
MNRSIVLGIFLCVIAMSLESAEIKNAVVKRVWDLSDHRNDESKADIKIHWKHAPSTQGEFKAYLLDCQSGKEMFRLTGLRSGVLDNTFFTGELRNGAKVGNSNLRYELLVDGEDKVYRVGKVYLLEEVPVGCILL